MARPIPTTEDQLLLRRLPPAFSRTPTLNQAFSATLTSRASTPTSFRDSRTRFRCCSSLSQSSLHLSCARTETDQISRLLLSHQDDHVPTRPDTACKVPEDHLRSGHPSTKHDQHRGARGRRCQLPCPTRKLSVLSSLGDIIQRVAYT
jgi:hypothetical protein